MGQTQNKSEQKISQMNSTYTDCMNTNNNMLNQGFYHGMGSMSSNDEDGIPQSSRLNIPKFDLLSRPDWNGSTSANGRRDATCKKSKIARQNLAKLSSRSANETECKRSNISKKH